MPLLDEHSTVALLGANCTVHGYRTVNNEHDATAGMRPNRPQYLLSKAEDSSDHSHAVAGQLSYKTCSVRLEQTESPVGHQFVAGQLSTKTKKYLAIPYQSSFHICPDSMQSFQRIKTKTFIVV
jgi:hypothetical protein